MRIWGTRERGLGTAAILVVDGANRRCHSNEAGVREVFAASGQSLFSLTLALYKDSEFSPPAFRNLTSYSDLETCGLRQKDAAWKLTRSSTSCSSTVKKASWSLLFTALKVTTPYRLILRTHRDGPRYSAMYGMQILSRGGVPIEYKLTSSDQGRLVGLPLPTARTSAHKSVGAEYGWARRLLPASLWGRSISIRIYLFPGDDTIGPIL